MFEFIKNFFKKLFKKDIKLIEESKEDIHNKKDFKKNIEIKTNKELPPLDNDTDPFEYINNLIKNSQYYNTYNNAVVNYNKVKKEYKEVLIEFRNKKNNNKGENTQW